MNTSTSNGYLDVLGQINLDELHIQMLFEHYQKRYVLNDRAKRFVTSSCKVTDEVKTNCLIGYCDRTISSVIPSSKSYEGASIRGSLQRMGLIRATGHELFVGCVVFPAYLDDGTVASAVGYRIRNVKAGDKAVIHWSKPEPEAYIDAGIAFARELIHGKAYH